MNKRPIKEARDPDLRGSLPALRRAALRAREIARKSGTLVIGPTEPFSLVLLAVAVPAPSA